MEKSHAKGDDDRRRSRAMELKAAIIKTLAIFTTKEELETNKDTKKIFEDLEDEAQKGAVELLQAKWDVLKATVEAESKKTEEVITGKLITQGRVDGSD